MVYQPVDMHKKKSEALVVHCADPRFQEAYRKIIDHLGHYYDLVVFPGASKAVVEHQSVMDNIKLLYSLHHFETVHILDHVHCGAFGEIEDEIKAHTKMIKAAIIKIQSAIPGVMVTARLLNEEEAIEI
jgi:hypothetical protein